MQNRIFELIVIILLCTNVFPQEKIGHVTYQSTQFVYVKYDDTNGINTKDTLYIKSNRSLVPVLVSSYVSSRSLACIPIGKISLKTGDEIIAKAEINSSSISETKKEKIPAEKSNELKTVIKNNNLSKQNILLKDMVRLSVQSYSTLSNLPGPPDRQQWRYLLSSRFYQVGDAPLLFSTYLTYKQRPGELGNNSISRSLNVYDLFFQYDLSKDLNVVFGRNINKNISNLSIIDGLQLNKSWSNISTGVILGSRPDFNYSSGLNLKLFETGAYIARTDSLLKGEMDNTFAFFEQTNSLKTDRRFIYFQHSNNIFNNIHNFISTEIDLYSRDKGQPKSTFNMTNLYFLSRYSINRNFSISLSYDSRKNVMYYETFKNMVDSLIDKETRQGIRLGMDIHPFKQIFMTINGGYNFKRSDIKPSRNLLAGISFVNTPIWGINSNLNYSTFENIFIQGNVYGINFSRELLRGNLYPSVGYRRSEYSFNSSGNLRQNFFTTDLSIRLTGQTFISMNYELELEKNTSFNRILIDISTRL